MNDVIEPLIAGLFGLFGLILYVFAMFSIFHFRKEGVVLLTLLSAN